MLHVQPSEKASSPQVSRPASGVWNPALDISVVVFPQPDGPSSVTNSLSLTVKLTSARTRLDRNDWARCSTRISDMTNAPDRSRAEGCRDRDDEDLDDRERGDRAHHTPLPVLEHGYPGDFCAGFLQEDDGVVVAEQRHEHEHERGEQSRPKCWEQYPAGAGPPARSAGPGCLIELGADPRQAGIDDHVRQRALADAQGDQLAPQVVAHEGTLADHQIGPEEADTEEDAGDRSRVDQGGCEAPPQGEAGAVCDQGGDRDKRHGAAAPAARDGQAVRN